MVNLLCFVEASSWAAARTLVSVFLGDMLVFLFFLNFMGKQTYYGCFL